ncbi:TISD protein, partial [Sakesphorus luctuosus]|nr:TISD protein [Sakesphorus luctuosus]
ALLNKENKFRDRSFSENGERSQHLMQQLQQQQQAAGKGGGSGGGGAPINSTRYKTELCRPFEESGACKYGEKCQFAHGFHELRSLTRHPKYKTELCRTFHTIGFCPYGPRCHFIHNADERRPAPGGGRLDAALLESPGGSRTPPPPASASYCEELLSPPCANNAFAFSGQELGSLIAPLALPTFQPLRRLSESPVFDAPPSPPDSLSDRESYLSGSLSSGSLSGSESPSLDSGRRLPIFSRLSISDD